MQTLKKKSYNWGRGSRSSRHELASITKILMMIKEDVGHAAWAEFSRFIDKGREKLLQPSKLLQAT